MGSHIDEENSLTKIIEISTYQILNRLEQEEKIDHLGQQPEKAIKIDT